MALLEILKYPDSRLRNVAAPVLEVTAATRQLVADMFETMYAAPGIGLAASQVDVHQRLLVIDISDDKSQPLCLINPEIVAQSGTASNDEGCLSVPDVFDAVTRAESIEVRALDPSGQPLQLTATGLLAVCIQHEMDHLEGKLFVDYLSELKRQRLQKKLSKSRKRDTASDPITAPSL